MAQRWSLEELKILTTHYQTNIEYCINNISRSKAAIYAKANKMGLSRRSLVTAKPFVKWAGGKGKLTNIIKERFPKNYNRYIEPFVGSGAVLFSLTEAKEAIISDINPELINAYKVIRGNNLKKLIESLREHQNDKDYFYKLRDSNPRGKIKRASRFIFLNKTCFNGLWRENSRGKFNVPFGYYKNPAIVNEDNLKAVRRFLNKHKVEIHNKAYQEIVDMAKPGDFVYMDPPYDKSDLTSFTKYNREDFSTKEQLGLFNVFRELTRKGVYVMMSNANTEFITNLYSEYYVEEIETIRTINSDAAGRKKNNIDVIITNYKTKE